MRGPPPRRRREARTRTARPVASARAPPSFRLQDRGRARTRRATSPGPSETSKAAISVTGITRIEYGDSTGSFTTPSRYANADQPRRPSNMPRGTPNASARLARISDCQATVAATWRRLNPRVCRIARSRRRRRTDVEQHVHEGGEGGDAEQDRELQRQRACVERCPDGRSDTRQCAPSSRRPDR